MQIKQTFSLSMRNHYDKWIKKQQSHTHQRTRKTAAQPIDIA